MSPLKAVSSLKTIYLSNIVKICPTVISVSDSNPSIINDEILNNIQIGPKFYPEISDKISEKSYISDSRSTARQAVGRMSMLDVKDTNKSKEGSTKSIPFKSSRPRTNFSKSPRVSLHSEIF